jgi:hypothetical protein
MRRTGLLLTKILIVLVSIVFVTQALAKEKKGGKYSIERVDKEHFKVNYERTMIGGATVAMMGPGNLGELENFLKNQGIRPIGGVKDIILEFDKKSTNKSPLINLVILVDNNTITHKELKEFLDNSIITLKYENGENKSLSCKPTNYPSFSHGGIVVYYAEPKDKDRGKAQVALQFSPSNLFDLRKGKQELSWKSGDITSPALIIAK